MTPDDKLKAAVYDKTGREIMIGDVVKIFHYTAALRRRKVYMYKQVLRERVWPSGYTCLYFSHLDMKDDSGFYVEKDSKVHAGYEIVQSIDAMFEDRPRATLAKIKETP